MTKILMKTNQLHLRVVLTQKVQNNYLIPFITSFCKCEQDGFSLKKPNWFLLEYSRMAVILRTYVCVYVCLSVCLVGLCVYPHACTCAFVYFEPNSHCVWSRSINAKLL